MKALKASPTICLILIQNVCPIFFWIGLHRELPKDIFPLLCHSTLVTYFSNSRNRWHMTCNCVSSDQNHATIGISIQVSFIVICTGIFNWNCWHICTTFMLGVNTLQDMTVQVLWMRGEDQTTSAVAACSHYLTWMGLIIFTTWDWDVIESSGRCGSFFILSVELCVGRIFSHNKGNPPILICSVDACVTWYFKTVAHSSLHLFRWNKNKQ